MHRLIIVIPALAALGCLRDAPSPFVGDCAVYPDGTYEYGQIGIGTCLASPADLAFIERGGGTFLAVSNANAFRDFDAGSVLFIDWSSVDLASDRNLASDLSAHAVELPHFPGTLAEIPERDLLAVPVRYSEGENTRESFDDLHLIDVSDPMSAAAAAVAEDGSTLTLQSDPYASAYSAGHLYVGNRTSHTISVVDMLAEPIELVDAQTKAGISGERFFDADQSGSTAAFSTIDITERSELIDEGWLLTYVDGSYQLWLPYAGGLQRYGSGGDGSWAASPYGLELDPEDSEDVVSQVHDPFHYVSPSLGTRMLFADEGELRGGSPGDFLADWYFDEDALLEPDEDAWDAWLGGPGAVQSEGTTWLFYDGTADGVSAIGLASSPDGFSDFSREGEEALFAAGGDHDSESQADPFVGWDEPTQLWRMHYSAFDGERWSIGQAWAEELEGDWTADSEAVLAASGVDCGAPVLAYVNDLFHMWYARREGDDAAWTVGYAQSADGTHWVDSGTVLDIQDEDSAWASEPPGVALQAQEYGSFRLEGEHLGVTTLHATAGNTVESSFYGFQLRLVTGQQLDLDELGVAGVNGVSVASYEPDLGLAYLDLEDATGTASIGLASWDGELLDPLDEPILEAGAAGEFDEDGVSSPVVFADGSGRWVMLYAGTSEGVVRIGRATSDDGQSWTRDDASPVFELGEDWDSFGAWPGAVEQLDDGSYRLWYSGSNGERRRIGVATSGDGAGFAQAVEDGGWAFGTGTPGDWDDTSVYEPWVATIDEQIHLWYAGYDGEDVRLGHAVGDPETLEFERDADEDESPTPFLDGQLGLFDYGGVERPVVVQTDSGWVLFYRGLDGSLFRPGLALGPDPGVFYKAARVATAGDRLEFATVAGTAGVNPIDLDSQIDGYSTVGTGLAALHLDPQLGYLFVASKLLSYIHVIDVRDDSTEGFDDANYLDFEALLTTDVVSGGVGFRGMLTSADGARLYALNDSPEGVFVFDLSGIEDDGWGDVVHDAQVGWLPAARGSEVDQGVATVASAGPTGLALLPGGDTLLVTNFNDNSLGVYDLRMGAYGQLVGEATFLGENPHVVRVSPDGKHAVVACYEGELDETIVNSTLAVIDVDPSSDTWLEVVTWITNQ